VFEITPKEQLLKNIRKGLVQPVANKYPLLNFENKSIVPSLLKVDEDFIANWVKQGFYFMVCSNPFDLVEQLRNLNKTYQLGTYVTEDKKLMQLFTDNALAFRSLNEGGRTLCCGFLRLESSSQTIYLSSESQTLDGLNLFDNIVLIGQSEQIVSPDNNSVFTETDQNNDLKVQMGIDYLKQFKSVFLIIED